MGLITTTTELQKYINVVNTVKVESLLPFVNDAQDKYLRPHLGTTLLAELDAFTNEGTIPVWADMDEDDVEAALIALQPYAINPLAAFAMFEGAPSLDVKITESGFAVISNNNLTPASAERVKNFRIQMEQTGWNRIETLLRFLETNQANYPGWVDSEAYTQSTRNLINTAELFDSIVSIEASRLRFTRMRPTMDNVEMLQIEPVISKELADVLRTEIRENNISAVNARLLIPLRRAVAYLTAGIEMDAKYTATGVAFLSEAKKILDADPDDYPEYLASDCYDSTKTSYAAYENEETNKNFVFGG